ncbi:bifunctional adenosylcobinamide kinase/adenosylcobinamide-phosphate guanylyltransferase [Lutimaribacter sp. EGI FJ00015]|uniref:Bifunctional adenosylcobinamide kinase/adenosylcobinamide-phosphate guanylyltransferase n=1 Tax=Lutimaribacter degradans TaxID=2945989 RepID=A0ACC5ZZA6_9RHOB|nr:bifunctional adenosylcobinamide kinase/adenosylcobinamide-phosphate guanylyltransferase [Lutimaribacter sp. EGI FJ00013]MCM2563515.1 bifunctional adenosylcobinamide kinase/adenosylcobinamide-phosphate guanylyltransferase [Lutimaribacter sp. EGI FJ00013]MCO0614695.1 bifunctional adenosylcobinamide kinase/adenosylcobinamide-phosphate guanylyltransferase [Lutimaribacter sp. EGI FJ00015]
MLPSLTLVLGGAASGKSAYAEKLAEQTAPHRTYLATARPGDDEMAHRIAAHRARRGAGWHTVEAPLDPTDALQAADGVVLFDCATMWLSNHLLADHDVGMATNRLISAVLACPAPAIVVSNELGLSIVPENALARRFRQAQGELNQRLAAEAGLVVFVAAGLPMALKGTLP